MKKTLIGILASLFLITFFSDCNGPDKNAADFDVKIRGGEPLNSTMIDELQSTFDACYNIQANSNYGFPDLSIKYDLLEPYLKISEADNNDTMLGVSLNYIMVGTQVQLALNLSRRDDEGIKSNGIYIDNQLYSDKYVLVGTMGDITTTITQSIFSEYQLNFYNHLSVKLRDTTADIVLSLANLTNTFPRQTFIELRQLKDLINQNNNDADYPGNPYLGMTWGAIISSTRFNNAIGKKRCYSMSPIIYVEKPVGRRCYNREGGKLGSNPDERYDKRALDLGKLCPPDCK